MQGQAPSGSHRTTVAFVGGDDGWLNSKQKKQERMGKSQPTKYRGEVVVAVDQQEIRRLEKKEKYCETDTSSS